MEENAARRKNEPQGYRQRLDALRGPLLNLHKALVDSERVEYEKTIGKIQSPNHFLQLLTSDPWFAWLSPLSQLIVSMDEALDEKEPLTAASVDALVAQSQRLLLPSETGDGFSKHYHEALQRDPDGVLAHGEGSKLHHPKKKRERKPRTINVVPGPGTDMLRRGPPVGNHGRNPDELIADSDPHRTDYKPASRRGRLNQRSRI